MNIPELKTFLAIVETKQLNRAGEQLHVTQSTVTARLNKLEETLGQTLFHRKKSGAELTSAGFRFERYAQLMVELWNQAQQETALPENIKNTFNLGCEAELWPGLGETIFEQIKHSQNEVAFSSWSGDQTTLDKWLDNDLIDAAICYQPVLKTNRHEYKLPGDTLVLVSTDKRNLVRWDPQYIYVDSGEEFRKQHAIAYPDGDTPMVTFGSVIWAKEYLIKTGGSAYLPLRLIQSELENKKLHRVPDAPEFNRNIWLILKNNQTLNWQWLEPVIKETLTFL